MVRQQQPTGDQEPGAIFEDQPTGVLDYDPSDGAGHRYPIRKKRRVDEVVDPDQPL